MKNLRYIPALILALLFASLSTPVCAQGLGINASTPATSLDINGDMSLRISSLTCANGNNNNINIGSSSFVRITGPNTTYYITGISGGVNGKVVMLFNATGQQMNLSHQHGSSSAANRIIGTDESDVPVKKYGTIKLIYSSTDSRWVVLNH